MKKVITSTILAILILLPLSSFATTTPTRDTVKQKIEEKKAQIASSTKERIEQRIDTRRETLRKIAQNRLEKVERRLEATIQRLSTIMSKIISRIEKVKLQGGNTENAEKYITEAKMHLDEAKAALTTLKNATSSADVLVDGQATSTSTIVKNGLKKLKDMVMAVEKHIREAHKSLENSVKALRGASSAAHATSTTQTSTSTSSN